MTSTNRLVIPAGYMGSGSSALTDLIGEFDGFDAPLGSYEYVFLHCPNGVFDLEDKLLQGNNALRSDEALRSFRDAMRELYDTPFWWVGDYKHHLTPRFMDLVDAYLERLTECVSDNFWYHQERRGWGVFPRLAVNKVVRTITGGKVFPKKPLIYEGMRLAVPTPDEFHEASRAFVQEVTSEIRMRAGEGASERGLILDQLILPHNAWRFQDYFQEEDVCFIVERDPRDVFLTNKHIWSKKNSQVPYPTDARAFARYYGRMRRMEKPIAASNVVRVRFEDLIYHYDETVVTVKEALGISGDVDQCSFKGFDPLRSIENTQLFLLPEFAEDADVIAQMIPEYLYEFPDERVPNVKGVF